MAGERLLVIVLVALCLPTVVTGTYYPVRWYMYKKCGYLLPLTFQQSALLGWSALGNVNVPSSWSCAVALSGLTPGRGVQLRFRNLDTTYASDCQVTRLTVSDRSKELTPPGGVCGIGAPSTIRTTDSTVTVTLRTDSGLIHYVDFEILLTEFSYPPANGSCRGTDFKCNNGICISSDLTCNGYNDCDDNSDEIEGCGVTLTDGVIVGIAVGVIFFILCVSVVVLLLRRRRRQYIAIVGV